MNIHKPAVAAAALVASLAFLAGCTSGSAPSAGSSPSPTAQPADELGAAILKLGTTTHKYTVDLQDTDIVGLVDPAADAVKITLESTATAGKVTADLVAVGTDLYARIAGLNVSGLDGTKWLHLDGTRVRSLHMFGISSLTDPVGVLTLTSAVKDVRKTGERTYQGRFDLTKAASGVTDEDIKELADKARDIPFEATLDAQGNLTGFTFTVPAVGSRQERRIALAISDHGVPVDVAKPPAAQVVEAPEALYRLLNPGT